MKAQSNPGSQVKRTQFENKKQTMPYMAVSYRFGGPQNGNFCQIHLELTVHKMIPGWHEFRKLPSLYKLADVCGWAENPCDSLNVPFCSQHMGIHEICWTYHLWLICKKQFPHLRTINPQSTGIFLHKNPSQSSPSVTSKGHPSPLYRIPPWARNSPSHICTSKSKSSDVHDGFTDYGHVQRIKNGNIHI